MIISYTSNHIHIMTTISVPISGEQEDFIKSYIDSGKASNKAEVFRKALTKFAEDEAVDAVLRAEQEPTIEGDLRELLKKL